MIVPAARAIEPVLAPIDQEESTARAARMKGRRTTAGTRGRSTVGRKRERSSTGSGIEYAPANAITTRTSRTTYDRRRGSHPIWTSDDETSMPGVSDLQA